MKKLLLVLLCLPAMLFAQKKHTVEPKETLFSISRKYNVHPRDLATFNNIPVNTSLNIGQVLMIPGKKSQTPLPPPPAADKVIAPAPEKKSAAPAVKAPEEKEPVYHEVSKKETLFSIGKKYGVKVTDITEWNHFTSNDLKEGARIIVGYRAKQPGREEPKPVVKREETTMPDPVPAKKETELAKRSEPVVEPAVSPVKVEPATEKKPENQPEPLTVVTKDGDFFQQAFQEQASAKSSLKEEAGTSGIFKSTSGWNDGKFYCLYNKAVPGTIVRISNNLNNKVVYAKVLDLVPDIKQNEGLLIMVSNAAASRLGIAENKFDCIVSY